MKTVIAATAAQAEINGLNLVKLLGLRIKHNGRIDTTVGEKSPENLYYLMAEVLLHQAKMMDAAWGAGYQAPSKD
jgi:hypothetical protein